MCFVAAEIAVTESRIKFLDPSRNSRDRYYNLIDFFC